MTDARPIHTKTSSPVLSIANLSIEFQRRDGPVRVVDDVSIDVMAGEIVGLIGESGSGKTLTALSALRLLPRGARIVSGSIALKDMSLREFSEPEMRKLRGDRMALVPQDAMQSLNPTLKVGRQVGEPLEIHAGMKIKTALSKAIDLLADVQIPQAEERAAQYPHQFSGGMQQRAMIAMGLAMDPELLIADEPTTALDVTVQAEVLKILGRIREERKVAILFITHDLGIVAELCDRVYVMREGKVVEEGAVERIFTSPKHNYTRMLLDATPSLHRTEEEN